MTAPTDTAELRRLLAEATLAESRLDDTTPHDGSDAYDTALGACLRAQDAYRTAADDALPALLDAADERDRLRTLPDDLRTAIDECYGLQAVTPDGKLVALLRRCVAERGAVTERVYAERDALRADVARLRAALAETRKGDATDGWPCWCPSPTYAKRHGGNDHSPICGRHREVLAATEPKP